MRNPLHFSSELLVKKAAPQPPLSLPAYNPQVAPAPQNQVDPQAFWEQLQTYPEDQQRQIYADMEKIDNPNRTADYGGFFPALSHGGTQLYNAIGDAFGRAGNAIADIGWGGGRTNVAPEEAGNYRSERIRDSAKLRLNLASKDPYYAKQLQAKMPGYINKLTGAPTPATPTAPAATTPATPAAPTPAAPSPSPASTASPTPSAPTPSAPTAQAAPQNPTPWLDAKSKFNSSWTPDQKSQYIKSKYGETTPEEKARSTQVSNYLNPKPVSQTTDRWGRSLQAVAPAAAPATTSVDRIKSQMKSQRDQQAIDRGQERINTLTAQHGKSYWDGEEGQKDLKRYQKGIY
jgi:hypothetical protein